MTMELAHPTPEAAALAAWSACPKAKAAIVRTQQRSPDEVMVVTDTEPSHPMRNVCRRVGDGWVVVADYS